MHYFENSLVSRALYEPTSIGNVLAGPSSSSPITKMVVVSGNVLWCGCQNEVRIFSLKSHDLIHSFSVVNDKSRQVSTKLFLLFAMLAVLSFSLPQARRRR